MSLVANLPGKRPCPTVQEDDRNTKRRVGLTKGWALAGWPTLSASHYLRRTVTSRAAFVVLVILLAGCGTVPFDFPRDDSYAIAPSDATRLSQTVAMLSEGHANESGFIGLVDGLDALGARLRLIEQADQTIDAQYFLMKGDLAGSLFNGKLLRAADRGVRVRLLLDDVFTAGLDPELSLLNSHPNIEVRLFNPISRRGIQTFNILFDFQRANRRMHNKSFTVDNVVTIVGGRNIADEYYQVRADIEFADFDVLGIGPVAQLVSETFDLFWNSDLAVPMEAFGNEVDPDDLDAVRQEMTREIELAGDGIYARAVRSAFIDDLEQGKISPVFAAVKVVTDVPEKLKNPRGGEFNALASELGRIVGEAEEEVMILTPYFVPTKPGVAFIRDLRSRDVRVAVVTNSLASTNHVAVHSGYAPRRKALLEDGVELYEIRADALSSDESGGVDRLTMHTKAIVVDRRILFIGSLNMDPRSFDINTEMGLFIDSAEAGRRFAEGVERVLPVYTYRLFLREDGPDHSPFEWHYGTGDNVSIETWEPGAGLWKNFKADFYRLLPLENQL